MKKNNVIRIKCLILSIITVVIVLLLSMKIYFTGFPDGYITDFDKAMKPFLQIAFFIYILNTAIFLGLCIFYKKSKVANYIFFINLAITAIIAIVILIILPFYFGVYLNLDNGKGG